MRVKASPIGLLTLTGALVVLAFASSPAKAAFGIAEWQVVTCKENVDTPAETGPPPAALTGLYPLPKDPGQCTKDTPSKWFKQAAGHSPFVITDFTLNTLPAAVKGEGFPDGFVKDIIVEAPEGLDVNPEATPVKCTVEQLKEVPAPTCPLASLVGFNYLTVNAQAPPCDNPDPVPDRCANVRAKLPVFNLVPFDGVPSMVGFPTSAPGEPIIIVGDLDPRDQHVIFRISDVHAPDGTPAHPPIVGSRLTFIGVSGNGTYLTNPSNCGVPLTATLSVDQHAAPGVFAVNDFTVPYEAENCEAVPFKVELETTASGATDSPEPATVDVLMPDQLKAGVPIANSHLLTAKVTLPEGAGLNPSVANGLTPCTDAQFKKGTDDPIECPDSSIIGSVDVESKALDQKLGGTVFIGQPLSNDPSSGEQFRIFIHVINARYGVNVRLIGKVFPNLQTGQLTAVVPENPQAPFNSFKINLNGGPRGALTSPGTCGPHTTTAVFTPWSGTPDVTDTSESSLSTLPGGGPCPKTLAERPFSPGYSAGPPNSKAGAFSPLQLHITRPDGAQELKQVNVQLPPGMVAKLRGVPYCPEASIAAAATRSGASELASPSCPSNSLVGTLGTDTGSGPSPFHINGSVYLAGPYKGAPVSMVFVTPAVAGPYDLGTVVIRAALDVDPETAVVRAVSDTIPDVFGGVKLDIRSVDVAINRKNFTLNPTTCREPFAIASELFGGGGNPLNPAEWSVSKASARFRASKCRALRFEPKFFARILGGENQTRRTANPKFRAVLDARNGDANLRRAAFILPRATILDQSHIRTICTRVQLAANECPKQAIYGHARATSPLLDGRLQGPVYLTSSNNELPDLLVDLRGQVNVRLRGVISAKNARLKTVFRKVPDVAVNKFILTMKGGNRGLLVNSENLCERRRFGFLNLGAQNSRRLKTNRLRLNVPAC